MTDIYIVIEQVLGKQVLKIDSVKAQSVVAVTINSQYKSLIEVDKTAILFSSCSFKECLQFVWGKSAE